MNAKYLLLLMTVCAVGIDAKKTKKPLGMGTLKESTSIALKAKRAVRQSSRWSKAELKSPMYREALTIVTTLGPLGVDKALARIAEALREGIITLNTARRMTIGANGRALAKYFGMDIITFYNLATNRGVFDKASRKGRENFEDEWRRFYTWVRGTV